MRTVTEPLMQQVYGDNKHTFRVEMSKIIKTNLNRKDINVIFKLIPTVYNDLI
jgi:hypothetical protein